MKPEIDDEAMGRCSHRTSRGERGQRAGKDQPRNLGDPTVWVDPKGWDKCISFSLDRRESAGPIVARKRVTTVERRGPAGRRCNRKKKEDPLD